MISAILLPIVIITCDGRKEPDRSTPAAAVEYAVRLLEAEAYNEFIDKAVVPSQIKEQIEQSSRMELLQHTRAVRGKLLRALKSRDPEPEIKTVFGTKKAFFDVKMPVDDLRKFSVVEIDGLWYLSLRKVD